jgi:hypothetical protein
MSLYEGDKRAGFTGMIVGAIVIFAILFTIVMLTNRHYAGERAERPAAAATR